MYPRSLRRHCSGRQYDTMDTEHHTRAHEYTCCTHWSKPVGVAVITIDRLEVAVGSVRYLL